MREQSETKERTNENKGKTIEQRTREQVREQRQNKERTKNKRTKKTNQEQREQTKEKNKAKTKREQKTNSAIRQFLCLPIFPQKRQNANLGNKEILCLVQNFPS